MPASNGFFLKNIAALHCSNFKSDDKNNSVLITDDYYTHAMSNGKDVLFNILLLLF